LQIDKDDVTQASTAEDLPNVTESVVGWLRGVRGHGIAFGWIIRTKKTDLNVLFILHIVQL